MPSAENRNTGPLAGLKVVDLTRVLSGPFCAMMLGDMGAEVIKIERPGAGDDTRAFAPPYQGDESSYFLTVNRNKKSVTLDMKQAAAKEALWKLVEDADILIENFRPGAAARLGFGYDDVAARNPGIIYGSISGFGDTGPEAARPGYDLIVQGESGMMHITGDPDGPPTKMGTSIADMVAGMMLSQGILAALHARAASGKGQHVKVSMLEALASLLTYQAGNYYATGASPRRRGNAHPSIVPYETIQAADGWLNVGVANDSLWVKFCDAIEKPELKDDARFALAPDRVRNRDELMPLLTEVLKTRDRAHWIAAMNTHGVPCGAIAKVDEICESATLKARGMIWEMDHATAGTVRTIGNPIEFTGTRLAQPAPPPRLGEHTEEVLAAAGYDAGAIARMKAEGVI
ncbi:MAG: CaiB/BaiF CoA-transferase family protein [Magnetovibrio sp.]|nr:CaiB/BaiF CoA-transferase family protein [Magnetovibrio sp.]